ncbi:MAG: glutaredoxin family protein [Chloroflexi bacterium]|nr:glutaredoxin family protein [Chloroflexota bacterium]
MAEKVIIYTKPGCSHCQAAKEELLREGLEIEEIDVSKSPVALGQMIAIANQRLVPVIVRGDQVIVGHNDETSYV